MPKKQYPTKPPKPGGDLDILSLKKLQGCAMRELHGVGNVNLVPGYYTAKAILRDAAHKIFSITGYENYSAGQAVIDAKAGNREWQPFIIFSDIDRAADMGGHGLAAFLREHNLGNVLQSCARKSWTGNVVTMWVWEVDYEALTALLDKWDEEDAKVAAATPATKLDTAAPTTPRPGAVLANNCGVVAGAGLGRV